MTDTVELEMDSEEGVLIQQAAWRVTAASFWAEVAGRATSEQKGPKKGLTAQCVLKDPNPARNARHRVWVV